MRAKAFLTGAIVLSGSVGLHLGGFALAPSRGIQIEGGAPMQLAMLGNSFADMTTGSIASPPPEDVEKPVEHVEALQPAEQDTTETAQHAAAVALDIAENHINPVVPLTPKPPIPEHAPALQPQVSAVVSPPIVAVPQLTLPAAQPAGPEPAKPLQTTAALTPVTPTQTVTAQPVVQLKKATPDTVRPLARPAKRVKPQSSTVPASRKGGDQSARKGQDSGTAAGKAASSSTRNTGKPSAEGNAAISNYPGLVMNKIHRVRKERAGTRGKAIVGFKVSASGAAASVHIRKSSGSAKIDSMAIRHIQRASPFPAPPKGAQRSFSVLFEVKR